ncbi:hypothetical protein DFH09DRAFT_1148174 [Mycena vulgaris]|nr:hypothetical protein DFH09DRAFT_1148174 [Mycena vulgaris]
MASRLALLILFLVALLVPCAAAQFRAGNLTHVLPECQTDVGVYEITYIYCTPTNFKIVEDCFNCQSANATQEVTMQGLLNDIVNNCNNKLTTPDSTISISPQKIVPSASSSAQASSARRKSVHPGGMPSPGVIAAITVFSQLYECYWLESETPGLSAQRADLVSSRAGTITFFFVPTLSDNFELEFQ